MDERSLDRIYKTSFKNSLIVDQSGTGDYSTIQAAIDAITGVQEHTYMFIKSGLYVENVTIQTDELTVIGLGDVIITNHRFARAKNDDNKSIGTFGSQTVYLKGANLHFYNLTFENASGPGEIVGQAVALYSDGDKVTFNQCDFKGFQDTLCIGPIPGAQTNNTDEPIYSRDVESEHYRHYFTNCYIEGTVDFIFGGGNAIFANCRLNVLSRMLPNVENYITAAATPPEKHGFTFYRCLINSTDQTPLYYGRPWRKYAKTRFVYPQIDEAVNFMGWSKWEQHSPDISNVLYEEIVNTKTEARAVEDWTSTTVSSITLTELMDQQFEGWDFKNEKT